MICVSVLYREPKLLKEEGYLADGIPVAVSVLYREPKLLKGFAAAISAANPNDRFSALP